MSLPTTQTNFATSRAADSWVEYPLLEKSDASAIIYHMRCRVSLSDYSPLDKNTLMSSAATMGVISAPFINANAYYVGDYGHSYSDGGMLEFDRQFATKPATQTREPDQSRNFPSPTYQFVIYTPPSTVKASETEENLWEYIGQGGGNNSPAVSYLTSTYYLSADIPTLPQVFKPTQGGNYVDYVTDGGTGSLTNVKALDGETFSAAYTVDATDPTASAYATSITNGDYKTVNVSVERYAGDIFVVNKYEMKAQ